MGDVVPELVEGVATGELGCELRDGEAGGFRGERAGARDSRVHLDDDYASVHGVDRELAVRASAFDADLAHDRDRGVS